MDEEIDAVIREHSWFCADINDAAPPFLYTIGLIESWNHPELILLGLESTTAHGILSNMVRLLAGGAAFRDRERQQGVLGGDLPVGIRRVDPTQHPLYFGFAMARRWRLRDPFNFDAVQVFWPDKSGKFPYDAGCDLGVYQVQSRLDIPLTDEEIEAFERLYGDG